MYKLDLENTEEPEIKLATFIGAQKKQANFRKNIYFCFIDYAKVFGCGSLQTVENFLKRWQYQTIYLPPAKPVCRSRSNSQNQTWNNRLVSNWERSTSRLYVVILHVYYIQYIMQNSRLNEAQAGTKIAGRNINNLRYANDTTLMAENKELRAS